MITATKELTSWHIVTETEDERWHYLMDDSEWCCQAEDVLTEKRDTMDEILIQNVNTGETHVAFKTKDGRLFTTERCNVDDIKDKIFLGKNTPENRAQVREWCGHCATGEELEG